MRSYILIILCFSLAFSCQREIHWDFPSDGSLAKDTSGNCLPISVEGIYAVNKPANDSNFLIATVNVTTAGTYSIYSDSVNGYYFKADGSFNTAGTNNVKLLCSGAPKIAGMDHFIIHYNNSECEASVNVLSDTLANANYVLQGAPDSCMNDTLKGSYLQGILLDTSNTLSIEINVITTGKYSVFTDTVNGYSFSTQGVFTVAGIQSIVLKANGTPLNSGNDVFTVFADSSNCIFRVQVVPVINPPKTLYFPLTAGSYWNYIGETGDTIRRFINGDSLVNDTDYIRMSETGNYLPQEYFFNLNGSDYYEFGKVEKYNSSFSYSPSIYGLLPFLKENLNTGDAWESAEFKGTASFGQVLYYKTDYYCVSSNATIQVNGFGFKNVYIVKEVPLVRSESGGYGNTNEQYYCYYAKGIGLVYEEESSYGHPQIPILKIFSWNVN